MIRLAVVGTGFGAKIQLPAFALHPDIELVAVVSARRERAIKIAEQFDVPHALDDYSQLLQLDNIDAVSIVTPPKWHYEMTLGAIQKGWHVLCEKPMAMNRQDAVAMTEAAARTTQAHAIDHRFRYTPARMYLKELVEEGAFGAIRTIRITHYRNGWRDPELPWSWLFDADQGGGILGAMGSHLIDMIAYTFGPVRTVAASLSAQIKKRPLGSADGIDDRKLMGVTADDTCTMMMTLENDAQVIVQISNVASASRLLEIEIHGERMSVLMEGNESLWRLSDNPVHGRKPLPIPERIVHECTRDHRAKSDVPQQLQMFYALASEWVQAMQGAETKRLPSFRDGLVVQEIMDAARKSSSTGTVVQPAE